MSLILSGTDGLSDVDGSAATPAIRGTDANTGIFFPAADTIAFSEGGVESMRIDSSGNVGIGTTAPLSTTANRVYLSLKGTGTTAGDGNGILQFQTNAAGSTSPNLGNIEWDLPDNTASASFRVSFITSSAEGVTANNRGSYLAFATKADGVSGSGTERMRIDSSGNVGIGTSAPSYKLSLEDSSNFSIHLLKTGSNDGWIRNIGTMDIAAASGGGSGQSITFSTGANYAGLATRAMIDGSGNMMFRNLGSTAPWDQNTAGQGGYAWLGNTTYPLGVCNQNNIVAIMNRYQGNGVVIEIKNGTTVVGSISHNGTNTAYNTSSDYRLKHSVQPMSGALARIAQLKPVTYKWKADDSDGEGFIAHELAEVFSGAVTGEKDALKEDGSINPQGIDTSFLVATLTAAIQEQQALILSLTARITALETP